MKPVPWLFRPSVRNHLCLFGLLLVVCLVAAVAQENTRPPQGKQPMYVGVKEEEEEGRLSWERDSCGNFPKGSIFTIVNTLPQPIVAYIQASNGIQVFQAQIAPHGPVSTPTMTVVNAYPPLARLCLPPGEYRIGVYDGGSEHIQAQSRRRYRVEVFSHEVSATAVQPTPLIPDSIRSQIDRIANGAHQELPAPTQSSLASGQSAGWSVENATGYELHLYLSGPVERSYVIASGGPIAVDLPPGSYRIAADVSHGVLPFYAVRQLGDARWSSHFYLARQ